MEHAGDLRQPPPPAPVTAPAPAPSAASAAAAAAEAPCVQAHADTAMASATANSGDGGRCDATGLPPDTVCDAEPLPALLAAVTAVTSARQAAKAVCMAGMSRSTVAVCRPACADMRLEYRLPRIWALPGRKAAVEAAGELNDTVTAGRESAPSHTSSTPVRDAINADE
jgi:hypothetical protein